MSHYISPHLTLKIPSPGRIEIVQGENGSFLEVGSWIFRLLEKLATGAFSEEDLKDNLPKDLSNAEKQEIFEQLINNKFVLAADQYKKVTDSEEYPWGRLGWGSARFYFEGVAYSKFLPDTPEGREIYSETMSSYASFNHEVPPSKTYENFPQQKLLPEDAQKDPFFHTLRKRRTVRNFNNKKSVSYRELSTLLRESASVQKTITNELGPHYLKASPSGGARHPVEVYPQILNVEGLDSGSYYYHPASNCLHKLGEINSEQLTSISQLQSGSRNIAFAFILTIRFKRNLWKYRYAKSFLFSWLDLGHAAQTMILCAEVLGLKCFMTPALDVELANRHLGLDSIYDECAAYLITFGRT